VIDQPVEDDAIVLRRQRGHGNAEITETRRERVTLDLTDFSCATLSCLRDVVNLLNVGFEWVAIREDVWVFVAQCVTMLDELLRFLHVVTHRVEISSYHDRC
jgi:hypothetical protein